MKHSAHFIADDLGLMAPAELLLAGSIVVGVALPTSAVIEASRPPTDMSRYQLVACVDRPAERCMIDMSTGDFLGVK